MSKRAQNALSDTKEAGSSWNFFGNGSSSNAAAAADRGAEGQLSAVPQTAEIASLTRRLLALEKPDLVHIITRGVYFGERLSYSSLVKDLPKPSMKGPTTELQRALNAVFRAVPNSRYGSTGDHYCFKRCKSPLDEFARVISTQISNIINQENWEGALEYAVEAGSIVKDMPHWDSCADNYHAEKASQKLVGLMICAIPKLALTSAHLQHLLQKINAKHLPNQFEAVVKILSAKV